MHHLCDFFAEKFGGNGKRSYLCTRKQGDNPTVARSSKELREHSSPVRKKKFWCGSSAWLEYMPVTHGVAGSSPVRTAINIEKSMFYKTNTRFYTQECKVGYYFFRFTLKFWVSPKGQLYRYVSLCHLFSIRFAGLDYKKQLSLYLLLTAIINLS